MHKHLYRLIALLLIPCLLLGSDMAYLESGIWKRNYLSEMRDTRSQPFVVQAIVPALAVGAICILHPETTAHLWHFISHPALSPKQWVGLSMTIGGLIGAMIRSADLAGRLDPLFNAMGITDAEARGQLLAIAPAYLRDKNFLTMLEDAWAPLARRGGHISVSQLRKILKNSARPITFVDNLIRMTALPNVPWREEPSLSRLETFMVNFWREDQMCAIHINRVTAKLVARCRPDGLYESLEVMSERLPFAMLGGSGRIRLRAMRKRLVVYEAFRPLLSSFEHAHGIPDRTLPRDTLLGAILIVGSVTAYLLDLHRAPVYSASGILGAGGIVAWLAGNLVFMAIKARGSSSRRGAGIKKGARDPLAALGLDYQIASVFRLLCMEGGALGEVKKYQFDLLLPLGPQELGRRMKILQGKFLVSEEPIKADRYYVLTRAGRLTRDAMPARPDYPTLAKRWQRLRKETGLKDKDFYAAVCGLLLKGVPNLLEPLPQHEEMVGFFIQGMVKQNKTRLQDHMTVLAELPDIVQRLQDAARMRKTHGLYRTQIVVLLSAGAACIADYFFAPHVMAAGVFHGGPAVILATILVGAVFASGRAAPSDASAPEEDPLKSLGLDAGTASTFRMLAMSVKDDRRIFVELFRRMHAQIRTDEVERRVGILLDKGLLEWKMSTRGRVLELTKEGVDRRDSMHLRFGDPWLSGQWEKIRQMSGLENGAFLQAACVLLRQDASTALPELSVIRNFMKGIIGNMWLLYDRWYQFGRETPAAARLLQVIHAQSRRLNEKENGEVAWNVPPAAISDFLDSSRERQFPPTIERLIAFLPDYLKLMNLAYKARSVYDQAANRFGEGLAVSRLRPPSTEFSPAKTGDLVAAGDRLRMSTPPDRQKSRDLQHGAAILIGAAACGVADYFFAPQTALAGMISNPLFWLLGGGWLILAANWRGSNPTLEQFMAELPKEDKANAIAMLQRILSGVNRSRSVFEVLGVKPVPTLGPPMKGQYVVLKEEEFGLYSIVHIDRVKDDFTWDITYVTNWTMTGGDAEFIPSSFITPRHHLYPASWREGRMSWLPYQKEPLGDPEVITDLEPLIGPLWQRDKDRPHEFSVFHGNRDTGTRFTASPEGWKLHLANDKRAELEIAYEYVIQSIWIMQEGRDPFYDMDWPDPYRRIWRDTGVEKTVWIAVSAGLYRKIVEGHFPTWGRSGDIRWDIVCERPSSGGPVIPLEKRSRFRPTGDLPNNPRSHRPPSPASRALAEAG